MFAKTAECLGERLRSVFLHVASSATLGQAPASVLPNDHPAQRIAGLRSCAAHTRSSDGGRTTLAINPGARSIRHARSVLLPGISRTGIGIFSITAELALVRGLETVVFVGDTWDRLTIYRNRKEEVPTCRSHEPSFRRTRDVSGQKVELAEARCFIYFFHSRSPRRDSCWGVCMSLTTMLPSERRSNVV